MTLPPQDQTPKTSIGSDERPPRLQLPPKKDLIRGVLGGFLGIGTAAILSSAADVPFLMAPFGATCVLLFAVPASPLAQPRNVIGGHLIAALIGLVLITLLGTGIWSMALGVGLAIGAMMALNIVHPPAGANPLVILATGITDWSFAFAPVFLGAVLLVAIAWGVNTLVSGKTWPEKWI